MTLVEVNKKEKEFTDAHVQTDKFYLGAVYFKPREVWARDMLSAVIDGRPFFCSFRASKFFCLCYAPLPYSRPAKSKTVSTW